MFPRESLGWEWEQDFHGNDLDGNGISIFLRELVGWDHGNDICTGTGNNPNSREILREFSHGIFPRTALEI